MFLTFVYASPRIMPSAKEGNVDRLLGSSAGEVIIENVLNKGGSYFCKNV